jgi:GrpB-like predicted nucleotidyltransferase (UPF0157 family)
VGHLTRRGWRAERDAETAGTSHDIDDGLRGQGQRTRTWILCGASGTAALSLRPVRCPAQYRCRVIEVHDYDPRWVHRFEALCAEYSIALRDAGVPFVAIEHVGSTSVPGLAAKPVLDIDIVVERSHVDMASSVLVDLGFEPRGELGIPDRWAFWEPDRLAGTNTYVVVAGSLALRNHLAVRDALRANADLRAEYGELKKQLGTTSADIYEYGAGKNAMVQHILLVAGLSQEERASIGANEVPITERNS